MGLFADALSVSDYRNFKSYELELSHGVTILLGKNAAGKTNLVEALELLTSAQSFRRPRCAQLIREGAESARIALEITGDGRVLDFEMRAGAKNKTFFKNGKKASAADVRGTLPCVLFCPDHLDLIKGSAALRRRELDDFGVQISKNFADLKKRYETALQQRNSLIRNDNPSPSLIDSFDIVLAKLAASLLHWRLRLLDRLRPYVVDAYASIADGEIADVTYMSSLLADSMRNLEGRELQKALAERMLSMLADAHEEDLHRGYTTVGPHRDELEFYISGRLARDFASQGQQRSLVLAWKIAEVRVVADILGSQPLLLLDDVMSELDGDRRAAFLQFVEGRIQTVITTTNLSYFTKSVLEQAKVVEVHAV